jgi:hypothetical protein
MVVEPALLAAGVDTEQARAFLERYDAKLVEGRSQIEQALELAIKAAQAAIVEKPTEKAPEDRREVRTAPTAPAPPASGPSIVATAAANGTAQAPAPRPE